MSNWWYELSSLVRQNAWAQVLSVLLLVLAIGTIILAVKKSSRNAAPKGQGARAVPPQAPAPPAAPAARVPATPAAPAAPAAPATPVAPAAPEPARPAAEAAAPRPPMTPDIRSRLLALLQARPKGTVNLTSMQGDADAQAECAELATVLAAAGWETVRLGPMAEFPGSRGFHFMIKNAAAEPEHTKFIIHAFIEAGLKPSTELNQALRDDMLLLVVGHR